MVTSFSLPRIGDTYTQTVSLENSTGLGAEFGVYEYIVWMANIDCIVMNTVICGRNNVMKKKLSFF